jgi:transposase-like protein
MSKPSQFSPEVRERAVRLVREQRGEHPSLWAAVETIAPMIGCSSQTLLGWVKRDQIDSGEREGVTTWVAGRPEIARERPWGPSEPPSGRRIGSLRVVQRIVLV